MVLIKLNDFNEMCDSVIAAVTTLYTTREIILFLDYVVLNNTLRAESHVLLQ